MKKTCFVNVAQSRIFRRKISGSSQNNYASIFGDDIDIKANHAEYRGMMAYLSKFGASLLEIVLSSDAEYQRIKQEMFSRSQVHHFEKVLDRSRALIFREAAIIP